MRIDRRNNQFRISLISRSGLRLRVVAGIVAIAVINLQVGIAGGFLMSQARAEVAARRLAVKVYPARSSDDGLARAVYVVLRGGADRLESQGFVRASGIPANASAAIATAWDHVNKGRAQLRENKLAEAFVEYTAAETAARPYMGYADRALVAHIYKGLGIGFVVASKPIQAKRAIKISLFAYPNQTKAEYSYSSAIENFFLSAQREIMDSPRGAMDVESMPEGAEVYVDYVFRGFSPLSVQELTIGEHIVTFVADGYEPLAQLVEITGGPNEFAMGEMIALDNSEAIIKAASDIGPALDGSSAGPRAGAYASLVGATDLIAIQVGDGGDSFTVGGVYVGNGNVNTINYSISKESDVMAEVEGIFGRVMNTMPPRTLALAPLEPTMAVAATQAITEDEMAAVGGEDLLIDPNSPLFRDTERAQGESIVKKWWFWTALIVGLGAVGGLTYWGVTSGDDGSGGTGTGGLHINLGGVQ